MSTDVLRNIFQLLNIAWVRRYTILIPTLLMPFLGFGISFLAPKFYEAHTTILLQDNSELNPILEDFSISTNLEERQSALKILLKSRNVLSSVAADLGYTNEKSSQKEIDEYITELANALSITFGGEVIKIYYRSKNKTDIASLLTTVTKNFLHIVLAPNKSWTKNSEAFLKKQLKRQKIDLQTAEERLSNYKTKHALELPELHKANITRLADLRNQLMEKRTDLAGAVASLKEFNNNLTHTNPVIGKLEEQLINIRADLTILKSKYTNKHSKIRSALRELSRLEEERQKLISATSRLTADDIQRLWNLAATTTISTDKDSNAGTTVLASQLQAVQEATARVTSLKNEVSSIEKIAYELEHKVRSFADVEKSLRELQRDYDIKLKLYDDFLTRYEMARVSKDLGKFEETDRIKIIDKPFTPSKPNALPSFVFVLAGFFAGLSIGTGLSAIAEVSDTSLRLRETLEKMTNIPVLTRLPLIKNTNHLSYNCESDYFSLSPETKKEALS